MFHIKAETCICENGDWIGYKNFLYESQRKNEESIEKIAVARFSVLLGFELGEHLFRQDNGAGDELWKECDEIAVVKKLGQNTFSFVAIHNECNLLECEKTDAEGQ